MLRSVLYHLREPLASALQRPMKPLCVAYEGARLLLLSSARQLKRRHRAHYALQPAPLADGWQAAPAVARMAWGRLAHWGYATRNARWVQGRWRCVRVVEVSDRMPCSAPRTLTRRPGASGSSPHAAPLLVCPSACRRFEAARLQRLDDGLRTSPCSASSPVARHLRQGWDASCADERWRQEAPPPQVVFPRDACFMGLDTELVTDDGR